mgnify:CR=1 FL=1
MGKDTGNTRVTLVGIIVEDKEAGSTDFCMNTENILSEEWGYLIMRSR